MDGVCTICGVKEDAHKHNYTEKVTKEPTCTEAGEKTLTCECGDTKTEIVPVKGHNYADGICTDCGAKKPCNHTDSNKDHLCDNCGEKISDHVDQNKDHNCDICDKSMSNHTDGTMSRKSTS